MQNTAKGFGAFSEAFFVSILTPIAQAEIERDKTVLQKLLFSVIFHVQFCVQLTLAEQCDPQFEYCNFSDAQASFEFSNDNYPKGITNERTFD